MTWMSDVRADASHAWLLRLLSDTPKARRHAYPSSSHLPPRRCRRRMRWSGPRSPARRCPGASCAACLRAFRVWFDRPGPGDQTVCFWGHRNLERRWCGTPALQRGYLFRWPVRPSPTERAPGHRMRRAGLNRRDG